MIAPILSVTTLYWVLVLGVGYVQNYIGNRFNGPKKRARRFGVMSVLAVCAVGTTLIVYVWTRHLMSPASVILVLLLGTAIGNRIGRGHASWRAHQVTVQRSR